jgi:hypothetical protein
MKGQTQWVSTLHQPTDYNGNFTLIYFFIIKKLFFHITIIVNNYFQKVTSFFTIVTLITFVSKAGRPRIMNKKKVLNELSHEEKHINKIIINVRKKVENFYN